MNYRFGQIQHIDDETIYISISSVNKVVRCLIPQKTMQKISPGDNVSFAMLPPEHPGYHCDLVDPWSLAKADHLVFTR